ncbi:SH3 domain-containing protein [Metarhizium brunneum]
MAFHNEVDDQVEFLLAPFRDIVSKAKDAAENAGDEQTSMRKAAETLCKEGQRALNRLEPLCSKIANQHGVTFTRAIKANEDIGNYNMELTDLLWSFDDCTAIETFDQEQYTRLQALCRNVAPKIYNILVQKNIELLSKMPDPDSLLHIVPESPPTSPLYPMSPSSYTWQLDSKTNPEPLILASPSWGGSPASRASHSQPGRLTHSNTAYSSSTTAPELAVGNPRRQSFSSGQSSASSSSPSTRSNPRRPTLPIRTPEESSIYPGQHWSLPQRLPSREAYETYPQSSHLSISESVSTQEVSPIYALAGRQPPSKAVPPTPADGLPPSNCVIDDSSSIYQYKGFCSGAKEVLKGNSGVKRKQKPAQRTLSRVVAKCTSCAWELDYEHIENDQSYRESGTMTRHDVHFRLRFLQKSHVAVKRADDRLFGCIFCVRNGYTLEESDATIFFSADGLLAHLARHARPLPVIPGIAVVYGTPVPPHLLNNHDLHFTVAPKPNPVHAESAEIHGRPTGVAMREVRRDEAQRSIVTRGRLEELQVAMGAKLTGIKWPPQYKGRKVFAWHDGNFASVPSDVVMLNAPVGSGLNGAVRTAVSARAKWKFSPKHGKDGWLRFDKGDAITNISCGFSWEMRHREWDADLGNRATSRPLVLVWYDEKRHLGHIPAGVS